MTVMKDVKQFIEDQGIDFQVISHRETFTTIEEARAAGVATDHVAKTLVIKAREGEALAVLPANERLDMHKLRDLMKDNHARLATEKEMGSEFTDIELGAVPPLGDLFGLPVLMDEQLKGMDEIIFAGGTHQDSVKVSGDDFIKMTHPRIVDLHRDAGEGMVY